MKTFNDLKTLVDSLSEDIAKFYNDNNKSAGVRVRKAMLEIGKYSKTIRKEIQTINADNKKS